MLWSRHLLLYSLIIIGSVSSQPADQGAITGLSTSIPCELGRQVPAPFLFINDTVYELFSIPQYFSLIPDVNSYTSLSIPYVTFMVDNVIFRCATFEPNGNLSPSNNAVRLVVQGDNLEVPDHNITALLLDYQRLFIQIDNITIAWCFSNICNEEFELQGFVISNGQAVRSPAHDIQIGSSNTAHISTSQLYDNSSSNIVYQLVAVWQNGTVCSDRTSQDTYYMFEESAVLQTIVSSPRSRHVCFELPSTETCGASLYFIWPQREEGLSCLCPVYNSDDGRLVFAACLRGCTNTNIVPRLEEGEICISNFDASMSETLVHFMCSTDPCTGNCFVKTILSSYRLLHSEEELILVGFYFQTNIPCDIETGLGFPHWFLNDTLYTLTTLLQLYPLFSVGANNSLTIVVTPKVDNTVFQCTALVENVMTFGTPTRINIDPNLEGNDLVEIDDTAIAFNYQDLEITNSGVRIGWTATNNVCSYFEVQRISRDSVTSPDITCDDVVVKTNSTYADIGLNSFLNSSYFRIVAVSDNGSICSDATNENTLYSFNGSEKLNTTYIKPNSEVCFDVPSNPENCGDIFVAWDEHCMSIPKFNTSSCVNDSSTIEYPTFSKNFTLICFTDQNYSLNDTLSHFLYTCAPPDCSECFNIRVITILSSHKVVISEPPTEPDIHYINSSLCFWTNSSIQVEIEYTISAIGLSKKVGRLQKPQCIDDPFLDECRKFNVTAIAMNAVGTSDNEATLPSNGCEIPPSKPNITYSNGLLCFEVDSITNVTLNYTIFTSEESDSRILTLLQSLQCVDDLFPNECSDFKVSALAENLAGSSQYTKSFRSEACQRKEGDFLVVAIIVPIAMVLSLIIIVALLIICCVGRYRRRKPHVSLEDRKNETDDQTHNANDNARSINGEGQLKADDSKPINGNHQDTLLQGETT